MLLYCHYCIVGIWNATDVTGTDVTDATRQRPLSFLLAILMWVLKMSDMKIEEI